MRRDLRWVTNKPVHTSLSSIQNCFHGGQFLEKQDWLFLTTEWLPWLQETVVYFGVRLIALATWAQIISYNWQPSEHLWASHYNCISKIWCFCGDSLTDVQWLLYLQDNGYIYACSLKRCMISGYCIYKMRLWMTGKLPLWLSYAISKIHNTWPLSLQLVYNLGNHSVVNLFLQCNVMYKRNGTQR